MFLLHKRLKHIKFKLKDWNKNEYGNIFDEKNQLKVKYKNLTKSFSQMALLKSEVIKPPNIINTGRIYVNKRKYFGDKNLEFND